MSVSPLLAYIDRSRSLLFSPRNRFLSISVRATQRNSWVAVFQFFICIPLAVPAALAGNPAVSPMELPRNLWDGWLCYLGYDSVVDGEHPDDCWPDAPLYVTLYLVVNIAYNILITLVRRASRQIEYLVSIRLG